MHGQMLLERCPIAEDLPARLKVAGEYSLLLLLIRFYGGSS